MAVQIKLGQDIRWGTTSAGTTTLGKILNISRAKVGAEQEIPDENNETYSVVFYKKQQEVQVEILAKTDAVLPEVGDEITTLAGISTGLFVRNATEAWRAGDAVKFNVALKKYNNA